MTYRSLLVLLALKPANRCSPMKTIFMLAFVLAGSAQADEYQTCAEVVRTFQGLALPSTYQGKTPHGADMYKKGRVCFNGRDVTDWAAGPGRRIASGLLLPYGRSEGIVEALSPSDKQPSYLIRIYEDERGNLQRQVLLQSVHSTSPENSVDRFQISWLDRQTGSLFFETPAYATNTAVWVLRLPVSNWTEPLRAQFVSRGWVEWGSEDSVRDHWSVILYVDDLVPGQGRVPRYYLHRSDGSRICQAREPLDPFRPTCAK